MADKNVVLVSNSEGHVWLPKFVSTSQPAEAGFVVWVWYQWKVSLNCNLQAMNRDASPKFQPGKQEQAARGSTYVILCRVVSAVGSLGLLRFNISGLRARTICRVPHESCFFYQFPICKLGVAP